jgi:hypothetical protein
LASANDQFNKDYSNFKTTNEGALQEILQHLERIVRDFSTKEELMREIDDIKNRVHSDLDSSMARIEH